MYTAIIYKYFQYLSAHGLFVGNHRKPKKRISVRKLDSTTQLQYSYRVFYYLYAVAKTK